MWHYQRDLKVTYLKKLNFKVIFVVSSVYNGTDVFIYIFNNVSYLHIPGKAYFRSTGQRYVSMCHVNSLSYMFVLVWEGGTLVTMLVKYFAPKVTVKLCTIDFSSLR
jgi:hypothetical protein